MFRRGLKKLLPFKKISSIAVLTFSSSFIHKADEKIILNNNVSSVCADGSCEKKKKKKSTIEKASSWKIFFIELIDFISFWIGSLSITFPIVSMIKPEEPQKLTERLVQFFYSIFSIFSNVSNFSIGGWIFGYKIVDKDSEIEPKTTELYKRSAFSFVEIALMFLKNDIKKYTSIDLEENFGYKIFEASYGLVLFVTDLFFIFNKKTTLGDEIANTMVVKIVELPQED